MIRLTTSERPFIVSGRPRRPINNAAVRLVSRTRGARQRRYLLICRARSSPKGTIRLLPLLSRMWNNALWRSTSSICNRPASPKRDPVQYRMRIRVYTASAGTLCTCGRLAARNKHFYFLTGEDMRHVDRFSVRCPIVFRDKTLWIATTPMQT